MNKVFYKEDRKKVIEKVEDAINNFFPQIIDFYEEINDLKKDIIDEREGLHEMSQKGIDLDNFLLEVEGVLSAFHPYYDSYNKVVSDLNNAIQNIENVLNPK